MTSASSCVRAAFILGLLIPVLFAGCLKKQDQKVSATAIIRVTHGDPPQPNVGEYSLKGELAIFTSYDFGKHVDTTLGLSKLWGVSENDAVAKVYKSISVRAGSDPGLFVITMTGLEHPLAVKILNELCTYYTEQQLSESSNNGEKPQAIHVSIIQRAE